MLFRFSFIEPLYHGIMKDRLVENRKYMERSSHHISRSYQKEENIIRFKKDLDSKWDS